MMLMIKISILFELLTGHGPQPTTDFIQTLPSFIKPYFKDIVNIFIKMLKQLFLRLLHLEIDFIFQLFLQPFKSQLYLLGGTA